MRIAEKLAAEGKGVSFECFPPKTEKGRRNLYDALGGLEKYKPLFVSVTYGAGGGNRETAVDTALSLKKDFSFEVMPHLTCIGASAPEIDDVLGGYKDAGVDNILALRGDPPAALEGFDLSRGVFQHASDLIKHIKNEYPFSCGAAFYPEGHFQSPSLEDDIRRTADKFAAGADFGVSQMFFDNRHYYDFLERASKAGIKQPLLPGIMPILNFEKIKELASSSAKVEIPGKLEKLMGRYSSPEDIKRAGIDYASAQCEDLLRNGLRFFHFFVMNRAESAASIIENAGIL